jgi:septal ring factor EnvC (AmiA/AmiB activator)
MYGDGVEWKNKFPPQKFFRLPGALILGGILFWGVWLGFSVQAEESESQDLSEEAAQVEAAVEEARQQREAEIAAREAELKQLTEELQKLKAQQKELEGEAQDIIRSIKIISNEIAQLKIEIRRTNVALVKTKLEAERAAEEEVAAQRRWRRLRKSAIHAIRRLAAAERQPPLGILLTATSLSQFFASRQRMERLITETTRALRKQAEARQLWEEKRKLFEQRREELSRLYTMREAQRLVLKTEERRERKLLSLRRQQLRKAAVRIAEVEQARAEIAAQIFVLKNVGITLDFARAREMAIFAGKATGVRPALILAVLKVESNLGHNVGKGRFPDDMHPAHRDAFLRLAEQLGFDPYRTPVSAKPTSYPGWGGAMGPGQIMPGIWEGIAPRVARILGKAQASPFEIFDAVVGTAVLLADRGAAAGNEYEAVNRYFAGPNWQHFTWYGDRVLAVAEEYERNM